MTNVSGRAHINENGPFSATYERERSPKTLVVPHEVPDNLLQKDASIKISSSELCTY